MGLSGHINCCTTIYFGASELLKCEWYSHCDRLRSRSAALPGRRTHAPTAADLPATGGERGEAGGSAQSRADHLVDLEILHGGVGGGEAELHPLLRLQTGPDHRHG